MAKNTKRAKSRTIPHRLGPVTYFRLDAPLHRRLLALAEKNMRSLGGQVSFMLREALDAEKGGEA